MILFESRTQPSAEMARTLWSRNVVCTRVCVCVSTTKLYITVVGGGQHPLANILFSPPAVVIYTDCIHLNATRIASHYLHSRW